MRLATCLLAGVVAASGLDPARADSGGAPTTPAPQLLTPGDPAGSVVDIALIQGRWRVVAVSIADGLVQAFGPDDPAYMGKAFVVAGNRLSWTDAAAPGPATVDDRCEGAATMRLIGPAAVAVTTGAAAALASLGVTRPDPHEVACLDGGDWGGAGGGAVIFPIDARTMVMAWYDNVILKLRWRDE